MHGYRDALHRDARDDAAEAGISREERTRRNATLLIRGAKSAGLASLAEAAGVSDSTVSRWLEKPETIGALIAHMGLKLLPETAACVRSKEHLDHLLYYAQLGMASVRSVEDLLLEDIE